VAGLSVTSVAICAGSWTTIAGTGRAGAVGYAAGGMGSVEVAGAGSAVEADANVSYSQSAWACVSLALVLLDMLLMVKKLIC
jgi:hypothetical protein